MADYIRYEKQVPFYGHWDVVVLGGGPSGVCAAVEAARNGARTLLIEASGMLGGMATTALVGPFMTNYDRDGNRPVVGGLYREIIERLAEKNAAILPEYTDSPSIHTSFIAKYHRHVTPIDSFMLQIVLDDLVKEAGVDMLLYTRFVDCICENGKIQSVILAALEGICSVSADLFIDCTGNADVAVAAHVPAWKGEEGSGIPQPGTLMFEIDGVDDQGYTERPEYPVKAYRMPEEGRYKVNHYHVFNVDAADSKSMTAGHIEGRKQILDAFHVLHDKTPGFENIRIARTPSVLGTRESRHIEGKYKLTVEDVHRGVKFDDRVAVYAFGMDVHSRTAEYDHATAASIKQDPSVRKTGKVVGNFLVEVAEAYYIPYRSMVPLDCDNLLVSGKTISSQSQAAGGLRVMPCAMALGQAAGAAAAIAVKDGVKPEDVSIEKLQRILLDHGAILD